MKINMLENKQKAMQKVAVIGSILLSSMLTRATWAHEGLFAHQHSAAHDYFAYAFSAGLQHTLSGIDHVLLAVAFGVLLFKLNGVLKAFSGMVALLALAVGFVLGSYHLMGSQFAEIGIGVSFVLMLLAFWKNKASWIMLLMAGVACHGMAHGLVVSDFARMTQIGFLWGMLLSFAVVVVLAYTSAHYLFMLHRKNAKHDAI